MCRTRGSNEGRAAVRAMAMRRVLQQLLQWIRAEPVVGFNSHCYDLNMLKSLLMRRLVCLNAVGDSGGDGDVADGGDDNSEGDNTSSCFKSDSGNSDNSEADADDDGDDGLF